MTAATLDKLAGGGTGRGAPVGSGMEQEASRGARKGRQMGEHAQESQCPEDRDMKRLSGFQPCPVTACVAWGGNAFPSLGLSFLFCKIGMITPALQSPCADSDYGGHKEPPGETQGGTGPHVCWAWVRPSRA